MIPGRKCAVCGGRDAESLHRQTFAVYNDFPLPATTDVVACRGCGFVYADTSGSPADYERYYRDFSKYGDPRISSGSGFTSLEQERFTDTVATLWPYLEGAHTRILDVGCAGGGLLRAFGTRGCRRLTGLDYGPECVRAVREAGFEAHQGGAPASAELDPLLRGKFGLVTMLHVLEHALRPNVALEAVGAWLEPGGLLYLETPNASAYPEHRIVPYYFFDCEHINHFTALTQERLGIRAGFRRIAGGRRKLHPSPEHDYPAVWTLFRKEETVGQPPVLAYDPAGREGILGHLADSTDDPTVAALEPFVVSEDPIAVWGAGSHAQRMMENSPLGRCNIPFFVDNDASKHGKRLHGIPIHPPERLVGSGLPVYVCVALFSAQVKSQILQQGLAHKGQIV